MMGVITLGNIYTNTTLIMSQYINPELEYIYQLLIDSFSHSEDH